MRAILNVHTGRIHPRGRRFSNPDLNYIQDIFSGRVKIFLGVASPPGYGLPFTNLHFSLIIQCSFIMYDGD